MVTEEENPVTVAAKVNLTQTLSPDSTVSASHTDREINHSIAPEKPSEDGYNWRKYGQKNVKGNEYIRSYYKCSYPNCNVKKQVERVHDGRITDVTYLGEHCHAKFTSDPDRVVPSRPSVRLQIPDRPLLAICEGKPSDKHSPVTDSAVPMDVSETAIVAVPDDTLPVSVTPSSQRRDEPNEILSPKRRKKGPDGADIMLERPGQESRLVVQTVSEVDIVNDGYRWRKYGQKMVKGNPNPRSYYRCSTAGCPVKKHVERASHDPKLVITTYEGQHEHNVPAVRTIVHQTPSPSSGVMESNGVEKNKSEETVPAPLCITYPTDRVSEDKDIPAIVVKKEDMKLQSDHDVGHKTDNGDNSANKATEEVKVALVLPNIKPEISSTEEEDSSKAATNLNGLQTTEAKPVNC